MLIVGAGPTGLVAANLLGQEGIDTLVIERNAATSDMPKAVLIDDEALRTCQAVGLAGKLREIVLYGYGARYISGSGRTFAHIRPRSSRYGYPRRNSFRQPDLEKVLLEGLRRFPSVKVRFDTELTGIDQSDEAATVSVTAADGKKRRIRADLVLACDGGRSTVRQLLGIGMTGSTFRQKWVVLDTLDDPDDSRFTKFICDPRRPTVSVPIPNGERRYEFMLFEHEDPDAALEDEALARLLAPHRRFDPATIKRRIVYTFHAVVAERLREGRVLLLGDAAHMMPPFAGQGMNTGIRDAHLTAWKAAAVVRGDAAPAILDSYAEERLDHMRATIRLSVRLGAIVMTPSRWRAALRDAFFFVLGLLPPARDYVAEMRFKPEPRARAGLLIDADRASKASLVGRMLPQPEVLVSDNETAMLDDVLGSGFALLAFDDTPFDALGHPLWARLNARRVRILVGERTPRARPDGSCVADTSGLFDPSARVHRGEILLVRPDRYVAGAFAPDAERAFGDAFAAKLDGPTAATKPAKRA